MRSGRLLAQAKPDDLIRAYNVLVSMYTSAVQCTKGNKQDANVHGAH